MTRLLADEFHSIEADLERGLVRINRSSQSFADTVELERGFARLHTALAAVDRQRCKLLVDIRAVGGRNDPEFERVFAPHRARMLSGFAQVAVLVKSHVGGLQVHRHAVSDGIKARAFVDESEALNWLGATPSVLPGFG